MSATTAGLPATIGAPEAEAALVGCLLHLGSPLCHLAVHDLAEADLSDPRNRVVLRAVRSLLRAEQPVDAVTVLGELRRSGDVSAMTADRSVGLFLHDLMAAVPVPESVGFYARIVKEHSARRRVAEMGERLQQIAGTGSLEALVEVLRAEVDAVRVALRRAEVTG